jgi:hypothetical protein
MAALGPLVGEMLGVHDGRGEELADQCLRHRVRGQDRPVHVGVLLGRLTSAR